MNRKPIYHTLYFFINIEPGKKQVETFDYVFEHEGMYKIVARVDHLLTLEESDETNNSYQLNVWVKD